MPHPVHALLLRPAPPRAAHTFRDLERDSLALLAGFQAELEERVAAHPQGGPSAAEALAGLSAAIDAVGPIS